LNTTSPLSLDNIPFPAFKVDALERIVDINQHALDLTGFDKNELFLKPVTQLVPIGSSDNVNKPWHSLQCHHRYTDEQPLVIQSKTKQLLDFSVRISQVAQEYIVCLLELPPGQQLQDPLPLVNPLAKPLYNIAHWRFDVVSNVMVWSDSAYQLFAVTPDKFKPNLHALANFFDGPDKERFESLLALALQQGLGFTFKAGIKLLSGKKLTVEIHLATQTDNEGKITALYGAVNDITLVKDNQKKLALLTRLAKSIELPIFYIDDNDKPVYQYLSALNGPDKLSLFSYTNFSIAQYLSLKNKAKNCLSIKKINISFDSFTSVFDLSVNYTSAEGIYIWIVENVTQRYYQQKQQMISSRSALLGNTFGNVSHDINNVLGVALGSIELLELKHQQGNTDVGKYIERVKNAIDKGRLVTERLLAFTRKPVMEVTRFDPVKEIKDNQYLFKQLLLRSINLSLDFKCKQGHSLIDFPQGEFINIILNIVLNAQDAIKEKGINGDIDIIVGITDNHLFEIKINDSGVGIAKNNLSRIFAPFYSSKSSDKGSGIGLANVASAMAKYNGQIKVAGTSELGGALFTLLFECILIKPREQNKIVSKQHLNIKGKHVLILDDEVSISKFIAFYLESEGAIATYINTKKELLALLSKPCKFDLFITDMLLPDITGSEAVDLVKAKNPQVKIYSISGYLTMGEVNWQYPILCKPFNAKELANFLSN
jgi:signal transduction histidine kinase/PAS domain-containing protein